MQRIDRRNRAFFPYLFATIGFFGYLILLIFFSWVFIFTDSFRSAVSSQEGADLLLQDPLDTIYGIIGLSLVFIPYFYFTFRSKKVLLSEERNYIKIDNIEIPINCIKFSREITIFGSTFVIITCNDVKKHFIFICDSEVKLIPFWIGPKFSIN